MLARHAGGDGEDEGCFPDGVVGEGALVVVVEAVEAALGTKGFVSRQALSAMAARVVLVAPAYGVALTVGLD